MLNVCGLTLNSAMQSNISLILRVVDLLHISVHVNVNDNNVCADHRS